METITPDDLRRMREEMELSQAELADAIGLAQNGAKVIRDAEKGKRGSVEFGLTPLAARCVRYLYALWKARQMYERHRADVVTADTAHDMSDLIEDALPVILL